MSKLTDWLAEDDAPEPRADNQSFQMEDWWDGWKAARKKMRELIEEETPKQWEHPNLGQSFNGTSPFVLFTTTRQYDER